MFRRRPSGRYRRKFCAAHTWPEEVVKDPQAARWTDGAVMLNAVCDPTYSGDELVALPTDVSLVPRWTLRLLAPVTPVQLEVVWPAPT